MNSTEQTRTSIAWLLVIVATVFALNLIPAVAAYFEHRWPLLSLGAAFSIWALVTALPGNAWSDRMAVGTWLLFSAYLLHGFEVDGIDLMGREFYFITHVAETRGIELSATDVMRMNTVTVYLLFSCAIWGGERLPWAGLAAAGMTLSNGLMHSINSITLGEYNPGLATALLLFIPGATYYLYRAHKVIGIGLFAVGGAVAYGLFGHIALLPLCVALDSPMWLMAGWPVLPLLSNLVVSKARGG